MRLGLVVTDVKYLKTVTGLIDAIRARGWHAECFLTDTGVMLLGDSDFVECAAAVSRSVSACEHSIDQFANGTFDIGVLEEFIVIGGQYQDAELVRRCDKVMVF